jgi:UDP-N-acetylglucosamine 2-epimerase (non-hydrolysing)
MRLLTLVGTRPEIIRLSRVIARLDGACEHVLVHTGQNYDPNLSDVFFRELGVRAPDVVLGVRAASFAAQVAQILERTGEVLERYRPERLLVLGDTNSGLGAIVAARLGIPIFHMEAGNRCHDPRVPEELNRRLIDHASTVLLPYTERSRENLLREGIAPERIYVTGNPIGEVLHHHAQAIAASAALARFGLAPQRYFLATLHRAENVDDPGRLTALVGALTAAARAHGLPLLFSVHPRTRDRLQRAGVQPGDAYVRLVEPLGFFDFVQLQSAARAVLSDSGTVQEECALLRVPHVTMRDTTERPETLECGSNVLAGTTTEGVLRGLRLALALATNWQPPQGYDVPDVSGTVLRLLLGHLGQPRPA